MEVPYLELPDKGVLGYGYPILLQPRPLHKVLETHLSHTPVILAFDRGGHPLALGHLLVLGRNLLLLGDQLPLIGHLFLLLPLLQVGRSKWVN